MSQENTKNRMVKRGKAAIHHVHVSHDGGLGTRSMVLEKRAASCSTGGFYKSPAAGQTVNTTSDLTMSWDPSCLSVSAVDIYLYAPTLATPRIHEWTNVPFAAGSYSTAILPTWWNSSESVNLQLAIVEAGTPAFLATMPAGPIFTAKYDPSTASADKSSGMAPGGVAAAVLVPIILVGLLVAGAFVKITRSRARTDRKRWSEAVDRRMSTISKDWSSITPAGATAAIRNSMAAPNPRASSFSFGGIRPQSGVDANGGQAGIGARGFTAPEDPNMQYARPGVGLRPNAQAAMHERSSRAISFADQVRPSEDSRRSRVASRAFHTAIAPPLPTRQDSSGEVSPVQREGAFTLTAEDIRSRLSSVSASNTNRPSVDEYMPALSMMRNGGAGASTNDLLLPAADMPAPPTPTHVQTPNTVDRSPVMGLMPMQAIPVQMSPDDLLRQYAERRATGSVSPMSPSTPVTGHNGLQPLVRQSDASRFSVAHGHDDDDEDPYGGHA